MKVLVTGFEPFGNERVNPSWMAVDSLENRIAGAAVVKCRLPVTFSQSAEVLIEAIIREKPDIVICTGQAGGRSEICIERVAINIADASIPDNEGHQPVDSPIVDRGPAAYFSTLPVKAMVEAIRGRGIPAAVSNSAGTYVCNYVMYRLLHLIQTGNPDMRGGFIHVPFLPGQVVTKRAVPSMSLETIVAGLHEAVRAAVGHGSGIS